jgi:hypothetical protein
MVKPKNIENPDFHKWKYKRNPELSFKTETKKPRKKRGGNTNKSKSDKTKQNDTPMTHIEQLPMEPKELSDKQIIFSSSEEEEEFVNKFLQPETKLSGAEEVLLQSACLLFDSSQSSFNPETVADFATPDFTFDADPPLFVM